MTPEDIQIDETKITCPICGGDGIDVDIIIVPDCCGKPLDNGSCCGNPIPKQEQQPKQCENCKGTGKVPKKIERGCLDTPDDMYEKEIYNLGGQITHEIMSDEAVEYFEKSSEYKLIYEVLTSVPADEFRRFADDGVLIQDSKFYKALLKIKQI